MRFCLSICLICFSIAITADAQTTAQLEQLKLLSIEEHARSDRSVDEGAPRKVRGEHAHDLLAGGESSVDHDFGQAGFRVETDRVTLGSKLEHNEFTGAELQPTAAVRWTRGPQTLWGSLSRAVRVPTRFDVDLRIFAPNSALLITGSDGFRSESLMAVEAGYRARLREHVALDVAVYDNRYDDLRSQEFPAQPGGPIVLANMLNATTRGGTDRTGGVAEANDPSHIIKARSHVNIGPRLELDAFYRFVGALPQPVVEAYAELDARAGWRLRRGWDLALIGANLLHSRHLEFRGGTPPELYERSVTLRSTWQF